MARTLRIQFPGAVYHVTFRGNGRTSIFGDDSDRVRLTERVAESAEDYGVRVLMYCWMSNHGHLLVETPLGNLSAFMGSVLTGYTVYYNLRHKSCGHLMQGRFKSVVVAGDRYLLRLSRYVHLNPVHVRAVERKPEAERIAYLRDYPWSSYREYAGLDKPSGWLETSPLLALVSGRGSVSTRYRKYVESAIVEGDPEFVEVMESSPLAIGDEAFVQRVESRYADLAASGRRREDVVLRQCRKLESVESVITDVCRKLGVDKADVLRPRRDGTNRGIVALALIRRCGLTQRDVAERLGLASGSAVGYLMRKVKSSAPSDPSLRRKLENTTR